MLLNKLFLLLFHLALVIPVCWMGWQDWQTREVSNYLTVPFMGFGAIGLFYRLYFGDVSAQVSLAAIAVLTCAAMWNWMGGADWKVLIGLWGLWPLGGMAALVGAGTWGIFAMIRSHDRNVSFPGISAFAVAILLTFIGEVSIISFS